jgi:hypothetical protein
MDIQPVEIGDLVEYVDEVGQPHKALVLWVFETGAGVSVNVVFVSSDTDKEDPYGRQIERETSVMHESAQAAHGKFWRSA